MTTACGADGIHWPLVHYPLLTSMTLKACIIQPRTWQGRAGHDAPFVNNYGVWADEFAELGLDGTLDQRWPDAHCWFGEQHEVRVGRAYGRCCSSQANPNPVRVFGWCVLRRAARGLHRPRVRQVPPQIRASGSSTA